MKFWIVVIDILCIVSLILKQYTAFFYFMMISLTLIACSTRRYKC